MQLVAAGALEVEPGYHHFHRKVRLGCSAEDVLFAYREDPAVTAL